jgi:IS30 family transposase
MEQGKSIKKLAKGKHLSFENRLVIESSLKAGQKVKWIALILCCDRSTIYREIIKGKVPHVNSDLTTCNVYNAQRAQDVVNWNKTAKGPKIKLGSDMALHDFIRDKILKEHYAPDVIAGILKRDNPYSVTLCTKTIYSYIENKYILDVDNGNLKEKTKRKKRGKGKKRPKKAIYKKKKNIRQRPEAANDRKEVGHCEGDLIVSGQGTSGAALLTIVDRKSRYAFIEKLKDKTQESVMNALGLIERRVGSKQFRKIFKTLTFDNGSEFLDWESIECSSITKTIKRSTVYFADPFSSWQRGSNENFNKMVRKFIPKGADIGNYTKKEIRQIEQWINNYPRRILNYVSAKDVFEGELNGCQA